jgi:hypothetical protein
VHDASTKAHFIARKPVVSKRKIALGAGKTLSVIAKDVPSTESRRCGAKAQCDYPMHRTDRAKARSHSTKDEFDNTKMQFAAKARAMRQNAQS